MGNISHTLRRPPGKPTLGLPRGFVEMAQQLPTRSSSNASTADASEASADRQGEEQATSLIDLLPDAPLLLVLSYLPPKDMANAARATARVSDLTRSLPSLWLGKRVTFESSGEDESDEELLDLLRLAPPVDKLKLTYNVERDEYFDFHLESLRGYGYPKCAEFGNESSSSLKVSVRLASDPIGLIKELGPTLKHLALDLSLCWAAVPLTILRHAPRLETLDLTMYSQNCEQDVGAWPPDLRLPRLYSVRLKFNKRFLVMHCFPFVPTEGHDRSEAYCLALRSLLKAHYGQITAVSLRSESREPSLQPLLEVCSPKLQRLAIERDADPVGILMDALTSGKGKFASLTSLDLSSSPPDLRRLGNVLARLPSLRLLDVGFVHCAKELELIPTVVIPALEMLLIRSSDYASDADLTPFLEDMVIRAHKQLHVGWRQRERRCVLFRHSETESECPVCAELSAEMCDGQEQLPPVKKCTVPAC